MEGKELAIFAAKMAEEKKAEDIMVLNLTGISMVTDYFVIASGNSLIQVKAIAEWIEEKLAEQGCKTLQERRIKESGWILLDYGDIVVHVMRHEERDFYQLEQLWGDGEIIYSA